AADSRPGHPAQVPTSQSRSQSRSQSPSPSPSPPPPLPPLLGPRELVALAGGLARMGVPSRGGPAGQQVWPLIYSAARLMCTSPALALTARTRRGPGPALPVAGAWWRPEDVFELLSAAVQACKHASVTASSVTASVSPSAAAAAPAAAAAAPATGEVPGAATPG
ncbi:hypothetical protein Agub_g11930, partial [Astrephomene gubernaculifera]